MKIVYEIYESPIGNIYVLVEGDKLKRIELFEKNWGKFIEKNPHIEKDEEGLCKEAIGQLREYFSGKRKCFDLKIDMEGTEFRKKVWTELCNIPYGETRSYLDIATAIDNPKAVRAVGQANRNNLIPIVIPCHRVIGKSGALVGFAGSETHIQKILLELEERKDS